MKSLLGYVYFDSITTSRLTKEAEARTWRDVKSSAVVITTQLLCVEASE
jgi:hypothetical protein